MFKSIHGKLEQNSATSSVQQYLIVSVFILFFIEVTKLLSVHELVTFSGSVIFHNSSEVTGTEMAKKLLACCEGKRVLGELTSSRGKLGHRLGVHVTDENSPVPVHHQVMRHQELLQRQKKTKKQKLKLQHQQHLQPSLENCGNI